MWSKGEVKAGEVEEEEEVLGQVEERESEGTLGWEEPYKDKQAYRWKGFYKLVNR